MASDSTGNVNTRQTPIDKAGQDAINKEFERTHGGSDMGAAQMTKNAQKVQQNERNQSLDDKIREAGG